MKGKIVKLLTLLMVASLFLAACGGGATEAPAEPAAPEAPAEPAEPEDPAEPSEPMMEEVTVVIGFTSSLTGKQEVSSKAPGERLQPVDEPGQ